MLTLSHVGVSFGATILFSDINLQVNAGERIALAGRNGAGKTTPVSYTHLTLPTIRHRCRSRWSPYH